MKRLSVSIIALLITLSSFACATSNERRYSFPSYGFSLSVPGEYDVITADNIDEYSINDAETFKQSGYTVQVNGGSGDDKFVLAINADYGTKYEKESFSGKKNEEVLEWVSKYKNTLSSDTVETLSPATIYDSGTYKYITLSADLTQYADYRIRMCAFVTIQGRTSVTAIATYQSDSDKAKRAIESVIDSISIQQKTFFDQAKEWLTDMWEDHKLWVILVGGPIAVYVVIALLGFIITLLKRVFRIGVKSNNR